MALVVKPTGMGSDGGYVVHPLFSSTRNVPKDPMPKILLRDDPITDNGRPLPRKQVRRAKVLRKLSRPNQLTLTSSLNLDRGAQLHPEDPYKDESLSPQITTGNSKSKNSASFELNSDIDVSKSFDIDPNTDRRKRQRTVSPYRAPSSPKPKEEGNWEDQLKAAAADVQSQAGTSRSQILVSFEAEKGLLKTATLLAEETPTLGHRTPKENILKLGWDGKLGSPKSRVPVNVGKSKKEKEALGRHGASETKIVIITYCKDEDSRSIMAQKIEDILTRPISVADALPANKESPQKMKTYTNAPSKPMHPFFLGKVVHQEDATTLDAISTCDKSTESQQLADKSTSHVKKATPVSRADTAVAWAKLGGLGRNSGISTTKTRFPGSLEPLWPPQDMIHIRSLSPCMITDLYTRNHKGRLPTRQKKHKTAEVQVLDGESVLSSLTQRAHKYRTNMDVEDHAHISSIFLRKPQRLVMTGHELLKALRQNIRSTLPSTTLSSQLKGAAFTPGANPPTNKALLRIFDCIPNSFTAFDKFECEAQEWVHKYAPRCAADLLQVGREVILLRDWLRNLTVTSVDSGNKDTSGPCESSITSKTTRFKSKKKRKRAQELDGFIVSSEDEANEMDELTDSEDPLLSNGADIIIRKSLIRAGESSGLSKSIGDPPKSTNTVVISGPHGCGKTAAVYAVAQELGFEVFEINAGSRRSGRDILDKVGDMTRNHLVHRAPENQKYDKQDNRQYRSVEEKNDLDSQSTRNAFLKPKAKPKAGSKSSRTSTSTTPKQSDPLKKQPHQKQSLILLEEVDILFEEDKQFWITVLGLISQSKRPIIMTCTDEKQLPLDEMALHAIFRLAPPPEPIAVDYLLLLAGNEGHLLSRMAVSLLFKAKNADLRASITELNFWCQMAVGDSKGGLEWLPIPSPTMTYRSANGERQRVVSKHSYTEGMGMLGSQTLKNVNTGSIVDDTALLQEALYGWDVNVEDWHELIDGHAMAIATSHISKGSILQALSTSEGVLDTISAADVLPGLGLRNDNSTLLDVAKPDLRESTLANYVEGSPVLNADSLQDPTNVSTSIALALKACSRILLVSEDTGSSIVPFDEDTMNRYIIQRAQAGKSHQKVKRQDITSAFGSLVEPPKVSFMQSKGPQISTFDGPLSTIAQDAAPYVRSIVSYDLRLEEQRLRLSNLLSRGGRNGKRQRTTRASRAALEGGSKAHTRRERWFPADTNFAIVLQTGGKGWQDIAMSEQAADTGESDTGHDGSRRSSTATTENEA